MKKYNKIQPFQRIPDYKWTCIYKKKLAKHFLYSFYSIQSTTVLHKQINLIKHQLPIKLTTTNTKKKTPEKWIIQIINKKKTQFSYNMNTNIEFCNKNLVRLKEILQNLGKIKRNLKRKRRKSTSFTKKKSIDASK